MTSMYKILIVDDYKESAFVTGHLLQLFGYEIEIAYDGASAIEKAKEWGPDVILMDIRMPGMDGFEACRKIRELPLLKDTIIIALTGLENAETKAAAGDAGFNDIVSKGVNADELQKKLAVWVKGLQQKSG